ncbi:MAG: acyltransferase [Pseudomonadota bacterium]
MNTSLAHYATSRDNNFNLIRYFAAVLVLISHSYPIALGPSAGEPIGRAIGMTGGTIAVDIFFISSGFLITSSYFARQNILYFVWARALRIYPALVVSNLFCVFVIGAAFTTLSLREYLSSPMIGSFLWTNSHLFSGVYYWLPGVFENNPYAHAINGSLWTLPYELQMYCLLAATLLAMGFLGKRTRLVSGRVILLLVAVGSVTLNLANHFYGLFPIHFFHLFSMFAVGTACFLWRDKIVLSHLILFLLPVLAVSSQTNYYVFRSLYSVGLPFLIFYLAYVPAGGVRHFNRLGDYSYGLYIYAFPVQQSLALLVPGISVWAMILWATAIATVLAALSWHTVEKRFLKLKPWIENLSRYRSKVPWTRAAQANVGNPPGPQAAATRPRRVE